MFSDRLQLAFLLLSLLIPKNLFFFDFFIQPNFFFSTASKINELFFAI